MAQFSQVFVFVTLVFAGLAGTAAAATVEEMLAEGSLGSDKAPVTVIEYASLTCPHCAAFANTTFEAFKKKYLDTGKVHFIYRDFPFDQPGLRAAMMVRCSGSERFFGFLEILFKSQESWASAADPMGELAKIARLGGMSKEEFDACMANKELMDGILKGELEAQEKYKAESTPTFIVNGVKHEGNMSLETLDGILAPLLK
ncbi:MAG: DsbA family protein [Alphaproteobacteria bacterium]